MANVFPFSALAEADLIIDALYEGGRQGNTGDDPLGKLVPGAGNQGGFRSVGSWNAPQLAVLYSSGEDPDWPDVIDKYTGRSCGRQRWVHHLFRAHDKGVSRQTG
jgi:hypothetical protein